MLADVTTGYRIKDVAERTGFSPATLRYYEEIGLMAAPARTAAGYRSYDDRSVERLSFIARAKQLGCSLDEIRTLAQAWDGGSCGPVQDGLQTAVAERLAETRTRIAELVALTGELERAAGALGVHRPEGACDDRCGCLSETVTSTSAPVAFSTKRRAEGVPIACTLPAAQLGDRIDEWRRQLGHVATREPIDGGVRLVLRADAPLAELTRLVTAEHACCAFFSFAITVDARGLALEVTAPADAQPIVHSLFGAPT